MPFPYRLHEEAYKEFIEAYAWYEERQSGLGDRFMNSVENKLKQISNNPGYYSKKYGTNFRQAKIDDFPYLIVYEFFKRKGIIHIAAIYHSKRNPKRKYRRLK
ncbi:MAG TPA: type II toxin-antitoxin system RelE/ParE family toxin [Chitinophagaceae bacterium]|nr:type II toxin-antitoxin system RelE/ParE family toxin [Chitinophagaceae bacterium]